jgi:hypothetical protein
MVIELDVTRYSDVRAVVIRVRTDSRPEDNTIWVWISRRNAVGEVQCRWTISTGGVISLHDSVDGDAECWMVLGR